MEGFKMTEEKLIKLKPILETALSRKFGKKIKLTKIEFGDFKLKISPD